MSLTPKQLSFLRSRTHALDTTVSLGKQGAGETFLGLLGEALARRELVKVRLPRHLEVDLKEVAQNAKAELVQNVGRTAVFFRAGEKTKYPLPKG